MYTHTHAHRARGGAWASGVCAGQRSCGARGCRGSGGWGGNCRAGCDGASDTGHGGCTVVSFVCVQVYCYETPNTGVYYDARHSCIQLSLILSHPTFSLSRARARALSLSLTLSQTLARTLCLSFSPSRPPHPPLSQVAGRGQVSPQQHMPTTATSAAGRPATAPGAPSAAAGVTGGDVGGDP